MLTTEWSLVSELWDGHTLLKLHKIRNSAQVRDPDFHVDEDEVGSSLALENSMMSKRRNGCLDCLR